MNRRSFLGSILAAAVAPAIVRADSLMRIVPVDTLIVFPVSGGEPRWWMRVSGREVGETYVKTTYDYVKQVVAPGPNWKEAENGIDFWAPKYQWKITAPPDRQIVLSTGGESPR